MAGSRSGEEESMRVAVRSLVLFALVTALAGCGDAQLLYAPDTPRDATGRPVDPVYGTPAPGTMSYGGGM